MPTASTGQRVLVVRHGETEWNRTGRIQGWAPVSLNDRGREQAHGLGAYLATREIDSVVTSDLRRTRETTACIREAGVEPAPTFSREWRERNFGVYQGLTREQLFGTHPEFRASTGLLGVQSTPEGGESLRELHERVCRAWDRLLAAADGETVLLVTHGGPIYTLLGHLKGMALPQAITDHSQDNCAITELEIGDTVEVLRENVPVQSVG